MTSVDPREPSFLARVLDDPVPTVLVCEDDSDTRAVMVTMIKAKGYEVVEANNGLAAVELIKQRVPDLVVSDVRMPEMDGVALVEWIRAHVNDQFVPVLLVTALGEMENKVDGLARGADDYLLKPFHPRELQARVQALLRVRELTEKLLQRSRELEQMNVELLQAQEDVRIRERQLTALQMAATAAHALGQPVTTIILQYHLLRKLLHNPSLVEARKLADSKLGPVFDGVEQTLDDLGKECETLQQLMKTLQAADPSQVETYVGGTTIIGME